MPCVGLERHFHPLLVGNVVDHALSPLTQGAMRMAQVQRNEIFRAHLVERHGDKLDVDQMVGGRLEFEFAGHVRVVHPLAVVGCLLLGRNERCKTGVEEITFGYHPLPDFTLEIAKPENTEIKMMSKSLVRRLAACIILRSTTRRIRNVTLHIYIIINFELWILQRSMTVLEKSIMESSM